MGVNEDARKIYDLGEVFRSELKDGEPVKMYVEGLLDEVRPQTDEDDEFQIENFIYHKLHERFHFNFNLAAKECHENAKDKGFWDDTSVVEKLALIHSEVSEVLEADRKNKGKNAVEEELADILIRTLDLCAYLDMDVDRVISDKMEKNRQRAHKHGNKY